MFARERIDFCPGANVTYTQWLAKYVLALRAHMSIRAVAKFTGLCWDTVKSIEKHYLAKTIRKRMDGRPAFWKHDQLTKANQQGFKSKIGCLARQINGYRNETFLHLKIYDLPNLSTRKEL